MQLLRTYPNLRHGRDYPFARGGERSVARGYTKALRRARQLVYIEDQYLWGHHIGDVFTEPLRDNPDLHIIAVVPLHTDLDGLTSRPPQLLGRRRAMLQMMRAAPGRVAIYGIENTAGTPVYVHAKTCVVDDTWATIGSDNFNRRSWTHDSELSAVVLDEDGDRLRSDGYAQRLRLTLAAEHLDRVAGAGPSEPPSTSSGAGASDALLDTVADCVDPMGMFAAYEQSAAALDAWHDGGRVGSRPAGRLRRMQPPRLGTLTRVLALPPYLVLHDPDGRPRPLRRTDGF